MTGMIVHDLKNPLNALLSLAEKPALVQTGRQMLNMVLNILDVQKFEDAKMAIRAAEFFPLRGGQKCLRSGEVSYPAKEHRDRSFNLSEDSSG